MKTDNVQYRYLLYSLASALFSVLSMEEEGLEEIVMTSPHVFSLVAEGSRLSDVGGHTKLCSKSSTGQNATTTMAKNMFITTTTIIIIIIIT